MRRGSAGGMRGRTMGPIMVVTASLLATLGAVVAPTPALAAGTGTDLFESVFNDRAVDGTGTVTVPIRPSGTNVACLTAGANSATLPLLSCAGSVETRGHGKLRLINSSINQVGGVFGQSSFPRCTGRDVTFKLPRPIDADSRHPTSRSGRRPSRRIGKAIRRAHGPVLEGRHPPGRHAFAGARQSPCRLVLTGRAALAFPAGFHDAGGR
jgi:hypothetical protein